jgi:hypothetical protein
MSDREMKELVKGFIRWLIIVLLVLNALVYWGIISAHCQEKNEVHSQKHTETIEQQDEIRFMFITVTDKNGDIVFYYRESKKQIEISMLFWDEQSVLRDPNASRPYKFKGCYAALICLKHLYIYWLERQPCSDLTGSFYFKEK